MFKTIFLAATLAGTAAAASDHWHDGLDMDRADLAAFRMTMYQGGKAIGFMEYGWQTEGSTYVIRDRTEMAPNVVETAKGVISSDSLLPQSVAIDFAVGENAMDVDLAWESGWRKGQFVSNRDNTSTTRDVNVQEDEPATLRMAVIGLVAALPLKEGYKTSMPWFNTLANRVENIAVITTGTETISSQAGAFECYRVELRGGSPENILFVTKDTPRRLVRIDVVGQPLHFELTNDPVEFLH